MTTKTDLGPISFPGDGETEFEYQDGETRRRVGFHDYAAIYAVPGLYERVFYEELEMCTAEVLVEALEDVVVAPLRVLDVGAGNGIGGEQLRTLGPERVLGIDLEPQAAAAAERDRPGVYDDYLVGNLLEMDLDGLRAERLTAVVACSAVGVGHLPAAALERVLGVLEPGGLFAFAVTPALLPGSQDPEGQATGYPDLLARLLEDGSELSRRTYVHRRQADGTPHDAVALVGRIGG